MCGQSPYGLQAGLAVQQQWYLNGQNYSRTLDAWLQSHNASKTEILRCLEVNLFLSADVPGPACYVSDGQYVTHM